MKNVGVQSVKVRATHPNYKTMECGYEMAITVAEMKLLCPGDTIKVYDGAALVMIASAEGVSEDDEIAIEYSVDDGSEWFSEAPVLLDTGALVLKVRATHMNYETAECEYNVFIDREDVPVKIYDEFLNADSHVIGDEYRVYDISGRLVRKRNLLEHLVEGLSGVYLVCVYEHGNCIGVYRVLK